MLSRTLADEKRKVLYADVGGELVIDDAVHHGGKDASQRDFSTDQPYWYQVTTPRRYRTSTSPRTTRTVFEMTVRLFVRGVRRRRNRMYNKNAVIPSNTAPLAYVPPPTSKVCEVRNTTPALRAQTIQRNRSFLGLKATIAFWLAIDARTTLLSFTRHWSKPRHGVLTAIATLCQPPTGICFPTKTSCKIGLTTPPSGLGCFRQ
jgi:hypothetical protein